MACLAPPSCDLAGAECLAVLVALALPPALVGEPAVALPPALVADGVDGFVAPAVSLPCRVAVVVVPGVCDDPRAEMVEGADSCTAAGVEDVGLVTTGPGPMLVGCDCTAGLEVILVAATTLVAPVAEFAAPAWLVVVLGCPINRARAAPMLLWSSAIRVSVAAKPVCRMLVKAVWAACMSPAPRSVEAAATALVTVWTMANGEASMSTPVIATSPIRGARAPRSGAPLAAAVTVPEFDAATDPALTPPWVPVPVAPAPDCKKPVRLLIASVRPLRSAVMRLSRCATPKPAGKSSAVAPVRLAMVASATKLRLFMNAAGVPARSKSSARASPDTGRRMESGTVTAGAAAELWVVAVGAAPEALGTRAALGARVLALGDG